MIYSTAINTSAIKPNDRRGVTLLEVLFAMIVAMVGILGVLSIVPFASRQAQDSYNLTHSTNAAINNANLALSAKSMLPSDQEPWCYEDDTNAELNAAGVATTQNNQAFFPLEGSLGEAYQSLLDDAAAASGNGALNQATYMKRRVYPRGFSFDPLFCSRVQPGVSGNWDGGVFTPTGGSADLVRSSRMPHFNGRLHVAADDNGTLFSGTADYNLTDAEYCEPDVSSYPAWDPFLVRSTLGRNVPGLPPGAGLPIKQSAAERLVASLADVLGFVPTDRDFGAMLPVDGVDEGSSLGVAASRLRGQQDISRFSWLATLVPEFQLATEVPTRFRLSVAIIRDRDRSFFLPPTVPDAFNNMGEELSGPEVVAIATRPDATSAVITDPFQLPISNGGLLNVKLWANSNSPNVLRAGRWVLVSRTAIYTFGPRVDMADDQVVPGIGLVANGPIFEYRNRWFKIVSVDQSETWPRRVTLQGPAWDYPDLPLTMDPAVAATLAPQMRTFVTVVPDVVSVLETSVQGGSSD